MRVNREAQMSPMVSRWLADQGLTVYSEVELFSPIDHVGVDWATNRIVCVEMKTTCSTGVLRQAMSRQLITSESYVCVPRVPRESSMHVVRKHGLGLIVNGEVVVQPDASQGRHEIEVYRTRLLERCRRIPVGGIGGLPTLKGEGPAIRCWATVDQFRKQNPKATWQQIWESVPNHYINARSMAGAMRLTEIKLLKEASFVTG